MPGLQSFRSSSSTISWKSWARSFCPDRLVGELGNVSNRAMKSRGQNRHTLRVVKSEIEKHSGGGPETYIHDAW
jgi:hypothetical protein